MPSSISIGPAGKIYVTDSRSHNIHVFDPAYISLGTIGSQGAGEKELDFPTDATIVNRVVDGSQVYELYVTDQRNQRIQVYDLGGNYLRTIYAPPPGPDPEYDNDGNRCGWFNPPPECTAAAPAEFMRLQAISSDSLGRLHVLDIFEAKVGILDAVTGEFIGSYGAYGMGPGLLKAPLDILLTEGNTALVTDSRSAEIEVFAIP
jgi:DNA-binding beta-propeller fold protein YncE